VESLVLIDKLDFAPERVAKKNYHQWMQPLAQRISNVERFLKKIKPKLKLEVVAIQDDFGPTRTDPNLDCIIGSLETGRGCEMGIYGLTSE
jgi:phosphopantetheine adenylyltransferase